jgi:Ca2+-binding RTX toxin-like protein
VPNYIFVSDNTVHAGGSAQTRPYTGPVTGITDQFVAVTSHDLNVYSPLPNIFIKTGSGTDAIRVTSGRNVLDGGTGSNFLVGGTGKDSFFVDGRGGGVTWSTVVNFHAGDDATVWGWRNGVSKLSWADNQGTGGFAGATAHIDLFGTGTIDDSITFAGYSVAQAQQFFQSSGNVQGNSFLYFAHT